MTFMRFLNIFSRHSDIANQAGYETHETASSRAPLVIIGLGNPGDRYAQSPHNAGFLVVDLIAQSLGCSTQDWQVKYNGLLLQATHAHQKTILFKPQTYMNKSGDSVAQLLRFYKLDLPEKQAPKTIYVVHDDLDLSLGTNKLTFAKSGREHNGVNSINQSLGTKNYWRMRVGVMPEKKPVDPAGYLTKKIEASLRELFEQSITDAAKALPTTRPAGPSIA